MIRVILAVLAAVFFYHSAQAQVYPTWVMQPAHTYSHEAMEEMRWSKNWCATSFGLRRPYGCDKRRYRFERTQVKVYAKAQPAPEPVQEPVHPMFSAECQKIGLNNGVPEDTIGLFDWFGPMAPKAKCSFAYETLRDAPPISRLPTTVRNCVLPAIVASLIDKEGPWERKKAILTDVKTLAQHGIKGFIPTPDGVVICTVIGTVITEAVVYNKINEIYETKFKQQLRQSQR